MKLPADVIIEALSPLGEWTLRGGDAASVYAYPRQFDGSEPSSGCVIVPAAEAFSALRPGRRGVLAVCAFPLDGAQDAPIPALYPARAQDAGAVTACLTALYDRLEDWDEQLDGCSFDMDGVQRMLEISSERMGGSFGLIDESYNLPAYTRDMGVLLGLGRAVSTSRPDDASIAGLADDPQITAVRSARGVQLYENASAGEGGISLYRNMFRPGESAYYNRLLYFRHPDRYTAADRFMLEHLARRIERITEHLPTFSVPVSQYEALKQHIRRMPYPEYRETADVSAALALIGWQREDSFRFFIFRSLYSQRDAGITDYILRRLERLIPGSCGTVDGERILLVQNTRRAGGSLGELRPVLAEFLRENMYKAGVSDEIFSFSRLRGAYRQAAAAMALGEERDPMFWYYLFENYLSDYLIRKASEDIPPAMLTLPAVALLLRHDETRGTHFAETLRVFSAENFNATHAARRLYIHRTSFQDRMDRIRALTGLDPEDEETRFLLQFSFRLLESRRGG